MGEGKQGDNQQQPGRMISQEELEKMLDTIQKLAESGANDAAKQMLSQLDDIEENLNNDDNAPEDSISRNFVPVSLLSPNEECMCHR